VMRIRWPAAEKVIRKGCRETVSAYSGESLLY
jgi:hypothetical protein